MFYSSPGPRRRIQCTDCGATIAQVTLDGLHVAYGGGRARHHREQLVTPTGDVRLWCGAGHETTVPQAELTLRQAQATTGEFALASA